MKDNSCSSSGKVVCFCGSTRFKEAYLKAVSEERAAGNVVLMSPVFNLADDVQLTDAVAETLEHVQRKKIQMADEILVINRIGYIGKSTSEEIDYAEQLGKGVRYLEEVGSSVELSELSDGEIWCALENPLLSLRTQEISSLIREIYKQHVFRDVSNELNTVKTRLDLLFAVDDGIIEAENVLDDLECKDNPTREEELEGIIAEGMIHALYPLSSAGFRSIEDMPLEWTLVSREFCKVADKQGLFVYPFFEEEYVWGRGQVFSDSTLRVGDVVVERRMIPVFRYLSMPGC